MNVERLERAISVMQRVRDHQLPLDMTRWTDLDRDPYDCHSAACFLGWCARDEVLHAAGLKFQADRRWAPASSARMVPQYEKHRGTMAAAWFFDIPDRDAIMLCQPDAYGVVPTTITPNNVIGRLQELLVNGTIAYRIASDTAPPSGVIGRRSDSDAPQCILV